MTSREREILKAGINSGALVGACEISMVIGGLVWFTTDHTDQVIRIAFTCFFTAAVTAGAAGLRMHQIWQDYFKT